MHIDNDSKAIYNKPIKGLLQTAADAALDMFVRSVITTMSAALFLAPLSWAETPGEKELQKGMEAWNRKQFAEAEPYFAEAVKTAPQNR
jgi:hypothetical protein